MRVSCASACARVRVHPLPSAPCSARHPLLPSFFPPPGSSTSVSGLQRSPPPRSSVDAVIVRCSSRCIVIRNNDFIKIHASMPGRPTGWLRACVRSLRLWQREGTHGMQAGRAEGKPRMPIEERTIYEENIHSTLETGRKKRGRG